METQNIIQELKSLGLDPANLDISRLDEDRVQQLLDSLVLDGPDQLATDYLLAMNEAINRAEAPNFHPDFPEQN